MNRKLYDFIGKTIVYISSFISIIILGLILYFVLSNGMPLLNWKIITGDNKSIVTNLKLPDLASDLLKDVTYEGTGSNRYGLAIKEVGNQFVITYISEESVIKEKYPHIKKGDYLVSGEYELLDDKGLILPFSYTEGVEKFVSQLNKSVEIKKMPVILNGELTNVEVPNIFTSYQMNDDGYISTRYGVSLKDSTNLEGDKIIVISKIHSNSPFKKAVFYDTNESSPISVGDAFYNAGILLWDNEGNIVRFTVREGAMKMAEALDKTVSITMIPTVIAGGGIRGSIITTIYLIVITLLIALPIGIFTAVYLHEMAKQSKLTDLLRSFVDMLTGIPSIIYGLMGAALFIPLSRSIFGKDLIEGGSLISGSLTLAVIVLPVIIKATESALDVVPKDFKLASLALGANETQTAFKVMLPNAIPGILSAALLSIGRVMGESAALIYAIGTVVSDDISVFGSGTSLAVHIWSAMQGETPNFALASTISIIILVVVLSLNLLVKLISVRLTKKYQ